MMIDLVQYVHPHGRIKTIQLEVSDLLDVEYKRILDSGCRFAVEILLDGKISLTIEDPVADNDVLIEVVRNGPAIKYVLEKMLAEFNENKLER